MKARANQPTNSVRRSQSAALRAHIPDLPHLARSLLLRARGIDHGHPTPTQPRRQEILHSVSERPVPGRPVDQVHSAGWLGAGLPMALLGHCVLFTWNVCADADFLARGALGLGRRGQCGIGEAEEHECEGEGVEVVRWTERSRGAQGERVEGKAYRVNMIWTAQHD
jgi:hypothetical protein